MTENKKKNLNDAYGIKQLDEYKNLVNQRTSALSSANQANKQALKYADNTALAQGYATQGAALQNMNNLQNAYQNQIGGINQQYQQQLGQLKNTASADAFTNYETELAGAIQSGNFNDQRLKELQDAYFGQMDATRLGQAQRYTQDALTELNKDNNYFNSINGQSYETTVKKVEGKKGANFEVAIGSRTYNVQLGGEVSDTKLNPNEYKEGELYLYQDTDGILSSDNLTYLITKDTDGKIRVVTDRAFGKGYKQGIGGEKSELYNIAKNLGLIK